jgi:alpha-L-arabinofuranosidase
MKIINILLLTGIAVGAMAQNKVTVDAAIIENTINASIYGSCIEDVNHEIYGGLYDQKIFGESFEEDYPSMVFEGFEYYGGNWHGSGLQVEVSADAGGKMVTGTPAGGDNAEVELKFGTYAEIAGLIVRVSNPSLGADNFNGYEVSLDARKGTMSLSKHRYNWQLLQEVSVDFVPGEWNRLRVESTGNRFLLFLNGETNPAIDYTDNESPLPAGAIGIRTYNSDVAFRNLKENGNLCSFNALGYVATNFSGFQRYGGDWSGNGSQVNVNADEGGKLLHETPLGDGVVEVEMKFANARESAALIVRVENPETGADNFDGYEIGLNAVAREIILGKHVHNWQSLGNTPVTFNPDEWNRLRVELSGARIRVYLNDGATPAVDYTDTNSPLLSGKIGLRTWKSKVSFRNLKIKNGDEWVDLSFNGVIEQSGQWDLIRESSLAEFSIDSDNPFNGKYAQKISYPQQGNGKAGLINGGLNRWGIAVQSGQTFQGRVYLRATGFTGTVHVALQSADGQAVYAEQEITNIGASWEKYPFSLTSDATDANARFAIWIEDSGTVWIDQAVLEGTGDERFHGLPYRADIGNAMVAEGLTFLRYGGTMVNSSEYRFKKMIGDPDTRPPYRGHWYPFSTNGFGIEDFLKFCEAAGFEPAFAINIEETAEDAADMIEYLNGDISTVWGAKRAENGHPEPYNLKYIEIGNEEVIDADIAAGYEHYVERFLELYDAMIVKDPGLVFINSAWWRPESPNMRTVFTALNGKAAYWDFHPWTDDANAGQQVENDLKQMKNLFGEWDANTTMKCAVFEENGNLHNMQRALGHATTLNAVRRMGDFVLTSCAANALQPYGQNDNGWDQGQIFFTPSQVWAMPPYYAQQMAAANHLPLRVNVSRSVNLDITAACDENRQTLLIHVVNTSGSSRNQTIALENFNDGGSARILTLSGNPNDENTPDDPEKIVPHESQASVDNGEFTCNFPPYSYTIIRIESDRTGLRPVENEKIDLVIQGEMLRVITSLSGAVNLKIFDLTGRMLKDFSQQQRSEYSFPGLNRGIYIVSVNIGNRSMKQKIMI